MIHLTFEGFDSQGGLALLSLPFCEFGKRQLAKVALLFFALPPHLFSGVLDPPGVLLLLENGVARNKGGSNTQGERGGMGHGGLLVLEPGASPASCG